MLIRCTGILVWSTFGRILRFHHQHQQILCNLSPLYPLSHRSPCFPLIIIIIIIIIIASHLFVVLSLLLSNNTCVPVICNSLLASAFFINYPFVCPILHPSITRSTL
ncbi:hypothetical protein C8J55DRAFT_257549 [Lentinula edodes]|uniref:Uncharacterized protein n=1 Tax=Lentinula lateritia TaxID=40482 RepID=A0A9W9DEJ4_9AGAR|nr:hypothetical protein C8J55DRAFT_257549 [Lentinula edodes]